MKTTGVGRWREARVVSVASFAAVPGYESGKSPRGGADALGPAESTVFASRYLGCLVPERTPPLPKDRGSGFAAVAAGEGVQPCLPGLGSGPPLASPRPLTWAHTSLPDAFCRTSCNMAAAAAA